MNCTVRIFTPSRDATEAELFPRSRARMMLIRKTFWDKLHNPLPVAVELPAIAVPFGVVRRIHNRIDPLREVQDNSFTADIRRHQFGSHFEKK